MSTPSKPQFRMHGGLQSYPAPSVFKDVTMHAVVLRADQAKIQSFVDNLLNAPMDNDMRYVALSSHLMLTFVNFGEGRFVGFENRGYATEQEVDFWVPLARVKKGLLTDTVEQIVWFCPYLFVDNGIALSSGREVYGFLKEWGWISMPTPAAPKTPFTLEAVGAKKFAHDTHIKRIPILNLQPADTNAASKVRTEWPTPHDAIQGIRTELGLHGGLKLPGLELAKELIDLLFKKEMPLVFIKQIRDATEDNSCCYQAVIEAPSRFDSFQSFQLENEYDFNLEILDSHPLGEELGLESQRAVLSFDAEVGFSMLGGKTIWEAKC